MQEYAPVPGDDAFTQARECYAGLEDWLASQDAAGLQHAELEEQVGVRGREVLRLLFQGHLDLLAGREVRRHDVTGEDGVLRTRAEKGRERPLATKFGQVTVSRIAYRAPGVPNVHPLDAALNLPEEKHSHGLRKLAAVEAVRGSHEGAAAAVTRATGVKIGKRQAEELVLWAARDVDGFCGDCRPDPAPGDHALVLTSDGKGIVMRPDALRPATAKAAAAAEGKLATRLSPGEKHGRKRMAELACVYDAVPVPRTPQDIISTPAQKRRKKKAQAAKPQGKGKPREPQAKGKWLTASVTSDTPAVIAVAFGEAERRDPGRRRKWAVLVDGNNAQIEAMTAEAASCGVTPRPRAGETTGPVGCTGNDPVMMRVHGSDRTSAVCPGRGSRTALGPTDLQVRLRPSVLTMPILVRVCLPTPARRARPRPAERRTGRYAPCSIRKSVQRSDGCNRQGCSRPGDQE
jgi:hypothetical protein